MRPQVGGVRQVQQGIQDPGVAEVHLRRLDLALADVGVPRLQRTNQERAVEDVEVAPDGGSRDVERTSQLRRIEDVSVPVRQHHPESTHGGGRETDAERRYVALQDGGHVGLPPAHAVGIGRREVRPREAAAQPEAVESVGLDRRERGQLQIRDAAGERFGRLPDQGAGCTAENQIALTPRLLVDQHPQQREQFGAALDLVDDDQALQQFQSELRVGQPVEVVGVFEVEVVHRPLGARGDEVARQRGLAALARPEDADHRVAPEQRSDALEEDGPLHCGFKIEIRSFNFLDSARAVKPRRRNSGPEAETGKCVELPAERNDRGAGVEQHAPDEPLARP